MQIVSELEKTRRGCYAGAIGYFRIQWERRFLHRTACAVLKSGHAYFQAGAAIVVDSDPQQKYEETVIKARAIDEGARNGEPDKSAIEKEQQNQNRLG